jgi:peptidoglycan hydrolase CwlO-like protein
MGKEILIAIASSSVVTGALTLTVNKIIANITRSRSEKRKDRAEAEKTELDAEVKRVDTTQIKDRAIRSLVDDTYSWIDGMNERLNQMREDNLRLEAAVFELTKRAQIAERERDWLRSSLRRLIDLCIEKCPEISVDEYVEELNKSGINENVVTKF